MIKPSLLKQKLSTNFNFGKTIRYFSINKRKPMIQFIGPRKKIEVPEDIHGNHLTSNVQENQVETEENIKLPTPNYNQLNLLGNETYRDFLNNFVALEEPKRQNITNEELERISFGANLVNNWEEIRFNKK